MSRLFIFEAFCCVLVGLQCGGVGYDALGCGGVGYGALGCRGVGE